MTTPPPPAFRIDHSFHVPAGKTMVDGKLTPGVILQAQAGNRLEIDCGGWAPPMPPGGGIMVMTDPKVDVLDFHKVIRKALMNAFDDGASLPIAIEAPTFSEGEHIGWHRVLEDRPKII
jgi:hypothetical protein